MPAENHPYELMTDEQLAASVRGKIPSYWVITVHYRRML
jgi:hypothetical protein